MTCRSGSLPRCVVWCREAKNRIRSEPSHSLKYKVDGIDGQPADERRSSVCGTGNKATRHKAAGVPPNKELNTQHSTFNTQYSRSIQT